MSNSNRDEWENRMRDDPRTSEELISAALTRTPDEDSYWDAVLEMQRRDSPNMLHRAQQLCQSSCPAERRLGADILGQLGVPERNFPEECLKILLGMLNDERDAQVLGSILIGLGHLGRPEAIEPASQFRKHPDAEVRHAVAFCLQGHEDQPAVDTLIELSRDENAHVRDWATFALGSQIDLDTQAVRDALAERLNDTDDDTRREAIKGLSESERSQSRSCHLQRIDFGLHRG